MRVSRSLLGNEVDLVEHQPARLAVQRLVVLPQFGDDGARVLHRIGARVERREVDQVQQQPRARRWRRNWWPRPAPSAAPSIRPGMSAMTKLRFVVDAHHAEVRVQRGERIVGDLGARARRPRG